MNKKLFLSLALLLASSINAMRSLTLDIQKTAAVQDTEHKDMTPLMKAAQNGSVKELRELRAQGISPTATDVRGNTALHYALSSQSYFAMQAVLDASIVNQANKSGITPAMLAVNSCQLYALIALLRYDCALDTQDIRSERTALMRACLQRDRELALLMAELLLDAGANPNIVDKGGISTLLHAVYEHDLPLVTLLVTKHADVEQVLNVKGKKVTALSEARRLGYSDARKDHPDIVEFLEEWQKIKRLWLEENQVLEHDATLHYACFSNNRWAVHNWFLANVELPAETMDKKINQATRAGETPLFFAAQNNAEELVRRLLAAGADPRTVVHEMSITEHAQHNEAISSSIKTMLAQTADRLDAPIRAEKERAAREREEQRAKTNQALKQALERFKEDIRINFLSPETCKALGSFVNMPLGTQKRTPLLIAVGEQALQAARQILDHPNANERATDINGNNALLTALSQDNVSMLRMLCSHKRKQYPASAAAAAAAAAADADVYARTNSLREDYTFSDRTVEDCIEAAINFDRKAHLKELANSRRDCFLAVLRYLIRTSPVKAEHILNQEIINLDTGAVPLFLEAVKVENNRCALLLLSKSPSLVEAQEESTKATGLMIAAEKNNPILVQELCRRGAPLDVVDSKGRNAFQRAHPQCAALIAEHDRHITNENKEQNARAEKEAEEQRLMAEGWLRIMILAWHDNSQMIRCYQPSSRSQAILGDGTNCNFSLKRRTRSSELRNPSLGAFPGGMTPATIAAQKGYTQCLSALLEKFPHLRDQTDSNGMSPLMHALDKGQFRVADQLLDKHANVFVLSKDGRLAYDILLAQKKYPTKVRKKLENEQREQAPMYCSALRALESDAARQKLERDATFIRRLSDDILIDMFGALIAETSLELVKQFLEIIGYDYDGQHRLSTEFLNLCAENCVHAPYDYLISRMKEYSIDYDFFCSFMDDVQYEPAKYLVQQKKINVPSEFRCDFIVRILIANWKEFLTDCLAGYPDCFHFETSPQRIMKDWLVKGWLNEPEYLDRWLLENHDNPIFWTCPPKNREDTFIRAQSWICWAELNKSLPAKAKRCSKLYKRAAQQQDNPWAQAHAHARLGELAFNKKNYTKAREHLEKAAGQEHNSWARNFALKALEIVNNAMRQ